MSSKEGDGGKSLVAPLDIPEDLKGHLPSAESGSRRLWVIVVIAAVIIGFSLWQLLLDSGPAVNDTAHPTTTFGK